MAQIIPGQSIGSTLGSALGGGFSSGLSSGLQMLAQQKMQQLHQRELQAQQHMQRAQAYQGYKGLGYSDELAGALAALPEPIQREFIKTFEPEGALPFQGFGEQSQQSFAPTQQMQPPQENALAALQAMGQPQYKSAMDILTQGLNIPQAQAEAPSMQAPAQRIEARPEVQAPLKEPSTGLGYRRRVSPAEERAKRQLEIAEQNLELNKAKQGYKERIEAHKLTKPEITKIREEGIAAKNDLHDLERMQELEDTGKLDTPGYVLGLERAGLDISSLLSPESQEFQKTAANFMRNAKQYFGARISNFEFEQFLKTIPNLSQSPEGRKRVIANLKRVARSKVDYNNALREVLRENNGVPPLDLLDRIDEKVEKKADAIAKKFKEDLARPVPAGQNKLITGLQAIAGTATPYAAGTLGGAALGSIIPGLGTAAGALTGAGLTAAAGVGKKILEKLTS